MISVGSSDKSVDFFGETYIPGYKDSFYDISINLGMEFANFNERFQIYLNILPGITFITRQYILAGDEYIIKARYIIEQKSYTYFLPAIEIGFVAYLTENILISTGWHIKYYKIDEMDWNKHSIWLIKLSKEDAIIELFPARLIIRI